jgi:glutathione S-transferase
MDDLILHQYEASPFSEKVRLVMGMKSLAWRAVTVPMMMPKPDVVALTGGYRRTPFLQIGADVFCDSALICRVLDRHAPAPALYPAAASPLQHVIESWADSSLFWCAIPLAMQVGGLAQRMAGESPEFMKAFAADRAALTVGRARPGPADNAAHLATQLRWLESLLADGRPFLLGPVPCIADVAAAQSVWHLRRAPLMADTLAQFPRVAAWYTHVNAFGQGRPTPMSSAEALEVARSSTAFASVRVEPDLGFEEGARVTVAATDYGSDPCEGTLVGLSLDEAVIEREDERAGRVRVHFPRLGYQIKNVKH